MESPGFVCVCVCVCVRARVCVCVCIQMYVCVLRADAFSIWTSWSIFANFVTQVMSLGWRPEPRTFISCIININVTVAWTYGIEATLAPLTVVL
jgi:hypothetical protein